MEEKRKKVPRAPIQKVLLRLNNMLLAVRVDRAFSCVFRVGLDDASCMPVGGRALQIGPEEGGGLSSRRMVHLPKRRPRQGFVAILPFKELYWRSFHFIPSYHLALAEGTRGVPCFGPHPISNELYSGLTKTCLEVYCGS